MTYSSATYVLIAAMCCVPLFIYFERTAGTTWTRPLLYASFEPEISRHTPRASTGTFLPETITASRTLGPADNPVIITKPTQLPAGVTVTLAPGTRLVFNEFASLQVLGTLRAVGSATQPIYFQSNELHPDNQVWNGLLFAPQSNATLAHVRLEDASPGITCLANSRVTVRFAQILRGSLGVFNASAACRVFDSLITTSRDGTVAIGAAPDPDRSNTITAPRFSATRPKNAP